jgi:hypothetical protein
MTAANLKAWLIQSQTLKQPNQSEAVTSPFFRQNLISAGA